MMQFSGYLTALRIKRASATSQQQELFGETEQASFPVEELHIKVEHPAGLMLTGLREVLPPGGATILTITPTPWKSVVMPHKLECLVGFDELEFEAELVAIKASFAPNPQGDRVTLEFSFQRPAMGPETKMLPYYVGRKEEDAESGALKAVAYCVMIKVAEQAEAPSVLEQVANDPGFAAQLEATMPPGTKVSLVTRGGGEKVIAEVPAEGGRDGESQ